MNDVKAQIISGKFSEIIARQKSDADLEIGELLVSDDENSSTTLFSVYDIFYGSEISSQNLERVSGLNLEESENVDFFNNNLRNYKLAKLKTLLTIDGNKIQSSKRLPSFFTKLRTVKKEDLFFISRANNGLMLGNLRSGTKVLDLPVHLQGDKVLSHHILITGTTGRGKSVLMKNLIWNSMKHDFASLLIFDPHDEYYGRKAVGMKDYPKKEKLEYYTPKNVPSGGRTLKVNLNMLRPDHFDFLSLSGPQKQIMYLYYRRHKNSWIKKIFTEDLGTSDLKQEINEMSLAVLRRRLRLLLDIDIQENTVFCSGIFDESAGETVISDIVNQLEESKVIIIDTSSLSSNVELLVASLITTEVFGKYKYFNSKGLLESKPVINIVLEEAPRVIGKEVLEQGPNVFSTIAREGRKFKIGLSAITQLPSLIPKTILANINTKIILGTEMNSERQSIIESASQDLSNEDRTIASLDKGEAIITSTFTRFALPISIPFFDEVVKKEIKKKVESSSFIGLKK